MNVSERQREPGHIESLQHRYDHDHHCWNFCMRISSSAMSLQLLLDTEEQMKALVRDVCACFGVADPERLVGAPCYVLRCWNTGSDVEGVESKATGKRFTRTGWCRANLKDGEPYLSPGERHVESLRREIAHFERRLAEARASLDAVFEDYIDWSVQ